MSVDISERDDALEVREVRPVFNAESTFTSVVAVPSVMVVAMVLSMPVAAGAEITASLDALEMDRPVNSGVSKSSYGLD
ncbi:unnamed protein product [Fusarium graminearum]|nr:unnamed protein product [Fusarium graminearum]